MGYRTTKVRLVGDTLALNTLVLTRFLAIADFGFRLGQLRLACGGF